MAKLKKFLKNTKYRKVFNQTKHQVITYSRLSLEIFIFLFTTIISEQIRLSLKVDKIVSQNVFK